MYFQALNRCFASPDSELRTVPKQKAPSKASRCAGPHIIADYSEKGNNLLKEARISPSGSPGALNLETEQRRRRGRSGENQGPPMLDSEIRISVDVAMPTRPGLR
jgi:hypothetical protein